MTERTTEKIINLKPLVRKFQESGFAETTFRRIRKFLGIRKPNSIKIDTIPRPLPMDSLLYNNALPHVILSEIYGLREENLTLDLDSIIEKARKKGFLQDMPLSIDVLQNFTRSRVSNPEGFITINYWKQFSGDYDSSEYLDKFSVIDVMFLKLGNAVWIYNDNNFGDGMCLYQITIRRDIEDLDEVVLGQDLFVRALEVSNYQIDRAMQYDCEIYNLMRGLETGICAVKMNPHIDPRKSEFAATEGDNDENENENDEEDRSTLYAIVEVDREGPEKT